MIPLQPTLADRSAQPDSRRQATKNRPLKDLQEGEQSNAKNPNAVQELANLHQAFFVRSIFVCKG